MKTLLECFELMKKLPLAKTIELKNENDLTKIAFPYFMKASLSEHKLEKNAVLKIDNLDIAKAAYNNLKKQFPNIPLIIQEQITGTEMILGLKNDAVFGKLLMIGFGGTNAEVLKDVEFRSIPVFNEDIKKAVESLKLYQTLFKRKKHNIESFIQLANDVSKLPFRELDLNPVILNEKGAFIVDARGD